MIFKKSILILGLLFSIQKATAQDSLVYKHQIGVGLPKLINHIFSVDQNSFLLNYRYRYSNKMALRSGLDFSLTSNNETPSFFALKLGFDRTVKTFKKWNVYYGLDLTGGYLWDPDIKSDNVRIGTHLLLGINYFVGPHFSVAMEPYLAYSFNYFHDHDTLDPDQQHKSWHQLGLGGVGFLIVNFHF